MLSSWPDIPSMGAGQSRGSATLPNVCCLTMQDFKSSAVSTSVLCLQKKEDAHSISVLWGAQVPRSTRSLCMLWSVHSSPPTCAFRHHMSKWFSSHVPCSSAGNRWGIYHLQHCVHYQRRTIQFAAASTQHFPSTPISCSSKCCVLLRAWSDQGLSKLNYVVKLYRTECPEAKLLQAHTHHVHLYFLFLSPNYRANPPQLTHLFLLLGNTKAFCYSSSLWWNQLQETSENVLLKMCAKITPTVP